MCLVIKRKKPRIAKFNIPIYKILKENYGYLQTPFQKILVNLREPLIAHDTIVIRPDCYFDALYIDEGVIHCFWNKYYAHKYLESIKSTFNFKSSTLIIQKAYIPKGTLFFIGRGKSFGQIGAERIIFKL